MSQWGAYGLALRGQGHEQILRYFYRGVEVRPYMPR
jgi:stage II sporulation protein D